jgi:LPS-assembly protein
MKSKRRKGILSQHAGGLSPFTSRAGSSLITPMLKLGAWIISPLLFVPLWAQEEQVLPEAALSAPAVDLITPVPEPEIPFGMPGADTFAMPKSLQISNYGGGPIEGGKDVGLHYKGPGIKITGDNGMEAFADSAVVDLKAKSATLLGNVSIYQGSILQRGDRAVYYYEKKFMDTRGLRAGLDPILLEAGKFTAEDRDGKKVFVGEDAGITTDDSEDPNFWVRARKITIYPEEKIVFKNLRLYAGDLPVFWLPYLSQPLNAELGYHFIPGSRSSWGPFLLNTYGMMLGGKYNEKTGENEDAWLLSRWHLDIRGKRGVAAGVDLVDTRVPNQDEISGLSFYYLNDVAPETSTTGLPRGEVSSDRYSVELKHRRELDFPDDADWRIESNITLLSDQYYLEDFDLDQYRTNYAPDNTLGIYRRGEDSLLSLFTRYQVNDFYRADSRLPEISFDQARGPRFGLPLLHEGKTSLGYMGEKAADLADGTIFNPLMDLAAGDPAAQALLGQLSGYERQLAEKLLALPVGDPKRDDIRTQLTDSSYARFNTYQELSMPMTFGNFLNVTPQAGLGYTRYAAANWELGDLDRTTLHMGAETSVKFSKDLGAYQNRRLGLDGLKHVLQPYAAWSFVSTDDFDLNSPNVDRLTPTTRPRPLDPVRFSAIDDIQSWNVVRMGARNRLLTKRDNQAFEWLFLDTYIDGFLEDPEEQRDFSNLYNDLTWQPVPWMALNVTTQFPIVVGGPGFNEFTSKLRFMPAPDFKFSLGYRQLSSHPMLTDSNQVTLESFTSLNSRWGFGTNHLYELDDGTLTYQQYALNRDLGNWVAGFGVTVVDNRIQTEYGLVFSLALKGFSSVALPFGIDGQQ